MSKLITSLLDIVLRVVSLIQQWRQKRHEEKRAWCLKVSNMRAELIILSPANLDWQKLEALPEALQVASQLDKHVDLLFAELQGTFGGIRRASYYQEQLSKARYYLRLLQTEKIPYDAEEFRQFYADVFWIIDTMMCHELRLTPQSGIVECYLLSPWYITVLQQLMSVTT